MCLEYISSSSVHLVIESDKHVEGTAILRQRQVVWLQPIFQLLWARWQWLISVFVSAAVYDGEVRKAINRIKSQAEEFDYCKIYLFQVYKLFLLWDILEIILRLEVL